MDLYHMPEQLHSADNSMTARAQTPPEISVLLPAYNAAATLPAALDSLLAQTFGDFEIVVVDDGSIDETGAILHTYAARDARVRSIRQAHAGVVGAAQAGLLACRGALVARMDADDLAVPERLALQRGGYGKQRVGQSHNNWPAIVSVSTQRW